MLTCPTSCLCLKLGCQHSFTQNLCSISSVTEWPVIKALRFPLHVIAFIVSRVRCFLTAGCAVTCAHQAFLCLLGCLLSTLMAIGVWVQASPDHGSQSWVSGTDRRNRNHINPTRTKRKACILLHHILNKTGESRYFSPFISSMCQFSSLLFTGVSWRPSATHTSFQRAVDRHLARTLLGWRYKTPCRWCHGLTSLGSKNKFCQRESIICLIFC